MAKKTSGSSKKSRPNIIIFMMDTQGARNMSCYGYRKPTTPNIDRIARQGALFENHFVTAPWTLPVHASLFTGRYESGHGAGASHEGLEPGLPSMAGVFGKNGYRSVALCTNHWAVDDTQWSAGKDFDELINYNDKGVKPVAPFIPSDDPDERDNGSFKAVGLALDWIDKHTKRRDDPFLMFINCTEPHDPYRPPEPWRSRFLPEGVKYSPDLSPPAMQLTATVGEVCPSFDQWIVKRCLYDAETACLDDRIGRFFDGLVERDVADDTIFIITGDHGDVIGEQVYYSMHSQNGVWDHVLKTPLIVRYPKKFKARTRCKELVQITDILPALMSLTEIEDKEAEASIQGENLLDAMKGPTREFALLEAQRATQVIRRAWTESVVKNPEDLEARFCNVAYKAARTKRYKYVWASNGEDMLFDTVKDPDERWNIIEQKPQIAKKLMRALEAKLMSMEQRYYMDMLKPTMVSRFNPHGLRRLTAWGFYQPGIVPAWTPAEEKRQMAEWKKALGELEGWTPGQV